MFVSEHLDLDVAWPVDQLFEIDFAGAKGALGLAAGPVIGALHKVGRWDGAHPFAAAAGGGFEHDRVSDLRGDLNRFVESCQPGCRAGDTRHSDGVGCLAGPGLRSRKSHCRNGRVDELHPWPIHTPRAKSAFSDRKP